MQSQILQLNKRKSEPFKCLPQDKSVDEEISELIDKCQELLTEIEREFTGKIQRMF